MAHHGEPLVPSTQANKMQSKPSISDPDCREREKAENMIQVLYGISSITQLTVPAADFDERNVLGFKRERPKSQT